MSARRAFNRYELKYIIDHPTVAALRPRITGQLPRDDYAANVGSYPVASLYYDSSDLHCYWEKIDGERFRRKLRIRHYGYPHELGADTLVWVEIKQRTNRTTQKRRAQLRYHDALALCTGHDPRHAESASGAFIEEVQRFVIDQRLRPTVVVRYMREAYEGRDENAGLRITFDVRLTARDRDLSLSDDGLNRFILDPSLAVLEIKADDRIAYWLGSLIARNNLSVDRVSKYCRAIDTFGQSPRSLTHADSGLPDFDLVEMDSSL